MLKSEQRDNQIRISIQFKFILLSVFFSGMWADDSDEDERPGFSGHGKRNTKDYSAPIGFVSGGVKVGDKVTKNENEEDQEVLNGLFIRNL